MCLATSCLWAGFAGSTCPCPWAGAFAACLAGAGAFAVIAAGVVPFAGAPPLGAAIAVPQRAPQRAKAIVSFLSALLFMVVFLSPLRASSFSRLHKARRFARCLLTKLRGGLRVEAARAAIAFHVFKNLPILQFAMLKTFRYCSLRRCLI